MDLIEQYFPDLTPVQKEQFKALPGLYEEWNSRINVISRKDIDQITERHILHSLSIALFCPFPDGAQVLDVGTGGGFPGVPLAILFPEVQFKLVDSIGKKIRVVNEISSAIGLQNLEAQHVRAERIKNHYDIVTARAVTRLQPLWSWIRKILIKEGALYALKGGDLHEEIAEFQDAYPKTNVRMFDLHDRIDLDFYETKKLLLVRKK